MFSKSPWSKLDFDLTPIFIYDCGDIERDVMCPRLQILCIRKVSLASWRSPQLRLLADKVSA